MAGSPNHTLKKSAKSQSKSQSKPASKEADASTEMAKLKSAIDADLIRELAKLLEGGKLAMADTAAVPAGKYGKAALEKLGSWQAAAPKFAMTENVRAALTLVARG